MQGINLFILYINRITPYITRHYAKDKLIYSKDKWIYPYCIFGSEAPQLKEEKF